MQTRRKFLGFTLIELLVVISIIALLIGILLPALGAARRTARQLQNSTQIRGIQQGMVTFAQGNKSGGGQGYFPGMTSRGEIGTNGQLISTNDDYDAAGDGANPAVRFAVMLNADLFTPEYILNPNDSFQAAEAGSGNINTIRAASSGDENYSYAALGLSTSSGAGYQAREQEWSETLNTQAVVVSDRNTGSGTGDSNVSSPWTEEDQGDWRGSVVHNDNSTGFETTQKLQNLKYGQQPLAETDNLFIAASATTGNDTDGEAYMVWGGTNQAEDN